MNYGVCATMLIGLVLVCTPLSIVFGTVIPNVLRTVKADLHVTHVPTTLLLKYQMAWYPYLLVGLTFGFVAFVSLVALLILSYRMP